MMLFSVCVPASLSVLDSPPVVWPVCEFDDGIVPHLLAEDVHVHVDLLLQESIESGVSAFDKEHEGVDESNPFDSLRKGDAVLAVPGMTVFGIVPCSWSVDDGDERIGRVTEIVPHHPGGFTCVGCCFVSNPKDVAGVRKFAFFLTTTTTTTAATLLQLFLLFSTSTAATTSTAPLLFYATPTTNLRAESPLSIFLRYPQQPEKKLNYLYKHKEGARQKLLREALQGKGSKGSTMKFIAKL